MQIQVGEATSAGIGVWTVFGPTSALLVTLFGWWIVERFARQRERRSDLRALIEVLDDSIDRIVQLSFEFYSLDGKEEQAAIFASSIKAKIATLATHLNTIRQGGIELNTDSEMKAFRKAVTGGAFESLLRPSIDAKSVKMETIRMTGEDLSLKVKAEFFRSITKKM